MSSRDDPQEHGSYREALALNNVGVNLLVQGHLGDSYAALQDSLATMKKVLRPGGSDKYNARSPCCDGDTSTRGKVLPHPVEVHTYDPEECPFLFLERLQSTTSQGKLVGLSFATYKDPVSSVGSTFDDPKVETAVIMSNFALCTYLLSSSMQHNHTASLLRNAYRIFDIALDLLLMHILNDRDEDDDVCGELSILSVASILVHTMRHILPMHVESRNDDQAAVSFHERFRFVQQRLAELEPLKSLLSSYATSLSAPAA